MNSIISSCLGRGALNNFDAQECNTLVGSRPDGTQVGRFSSWGTVLPKGFLATLPTSHCVSLT